MYFAMKLPKFGVWSCGKTFQVKIFDVQLFSIITRDGLVEHRQGTQEQGKNNQCGEDEFVVQL